LVVPTSTSVAPALAITSGMRKAPPISTSSPRETMTSATRQRRNRQQHRRRVVVDHGGGLGARQRAQQFLDDAVAVAAAATGQVVFEVVRAGHHRQQVLQRAVGQHAGAAEVGVDDGAGQVEHRGSACAAPGATRPGAAARLAQFLQQKKPIFRHRSCLVLHNIRPFELDMAGPSSSSLRKGVSRFGVAGCVPAWGVSPNTLICPPAETLDINHET
jgi:hypothetical protein